MEERNEYDWWGYLHTSGTYQAKRYFGQIDIDEANESPFCKIVVGPFKAKGREDALRKVEELTKQEDDVTYLEPEITTEVEKDVIRLDFLDWLTEQEIIMNPQTVWETYITERANE